VGPDSDHVFLEALADANAGIESTRDDVAQAIVDHDIEHHLGVRPVKAAQPRRDDLLLPCPMC